MIINVNANQYHGLLRQDLNGTGTMTRRKGLLYIALKFSPCSGSGNGAGTNGLPSHFYTFRDHPEGTLYGNLNMSSSWSHSPYQCENFGVKLLLVPCFQSPPANLARPGGVWNQKFCFHSPSQSATKFLQSLLTVRQVSQSNPSNLPLLQMWHVENVTGHHAVYTLIQCTPLLVEKAGVAPDVTFRITACKQESVQARYPLWIWNPWGRTHEVQNRSNQWLHKMDLGPDKKIKKRKKKVFSQWWNLQSLPCVNLCKSFIADCKSSVTNCKNL